MRADRLVGVADLDRNFNGGIEHLAAIRPRLVRRAPHIKLLRCAADVDLDRHERELRVARGLGRIGFPGLGRLGGVLCAGDGVELRLRLDPGGVDLRPQVRGLGGGLLLELLGLRPGFVRLCGGERLVGRREFGVGAGLESFQLAQRRVKRCCRARRCRGGFLRLDGRPRGLGGFAGERLGTRRRSRDGLRLRGEERRVGKLDRGRVDRRYDHPHPEPRLVEQLLRKAKGHPHAAVRRRISGQRPAVQRDAVPGDALHVRHVGIVIHVRAVVLFLLDEGEDAGWRLASLGAGRHRRAQDPAVGVVERDLLGLDRHDRHDRLACIARRRRLAGCRAARFFRCGVGGRRHQCGHRREHGCNARPPTKPPTPHRHGGLRRRHSICHLIPRLKCLPTLASKSVRSRFLHFINCRRDPNTANSLLETIALSEGNLSYPFRFWRLGGALHSGNTFCKSMMIRTFGHCAVLFWPEKSARYA